MADQPGTGDVHVDGLLTQLSLGITNDRFISRFFFPQVQVNKQSDLIATYTKSDQFRLAAKKTTEREPPPLGGYTVGSDSYFCEEWSIGHFISDRRRANTDVPYNAERDGTIWLVDKLELAHEYEFVNSFWTTGEWTVDKVGASDFTKWSDYATSTPITDIRGWSRTIRRALGGFSPNTFGVGDLCWDKLADHPDFLERIKYGSSSASPAMVTPNLVAQLCGLERVLVGVSMYTTDAEGTAEGSVTYTPFWDDDALLMYVSPRPSLWSASAGYRFNWSTVWGGGRYVRRRRDPISEKGWLMEAFEFWDMKMTEPDAAIFISDAVD